MAIQTVTKVVAQSARRILAQRGMTQEELSVTTGIPPRTLARRLHNTNPSGTTLEESAAIATALDVPLSYLLSENPIVEREAAA